MMLSTLRRSLVLLLTLGTAFAAVPERGLAQTQQDDNTQYGTRAGEFLLLPVGARGAAFGQAFSAVAEDPTAIHWNPAGIAFMRQGGAHITHLDYIAGTSYTWAGAALPLGAGDWVVGAHFGGFSFGDQERTTVEQPEGTGAFYSNSMTTAGLSLAMNVTDRFSFGLTGKFVQERLANTSASTFSADIGTNYHTVIGDRWLRAAFSLMNLGGALQLRGADLERNLTETNPNLPGRQDQGALRTGEFSLPTLFKVSVAYQAVATPNSQVIVAGEFWQPNQNSTSGGIGAEYMFRPTGETGFSAAVRGGYVYEPDRSFEENGVSFDDEGTDGLSLGGGLGWRARDNGLGFMLDYTYRNMGLLPAANLFSLTFTW